MLAILMADSNEVAGFLFTYSSIGIPERMINEDRDFYMVKAKLWICRMVISLPSNSLQYKSPEFTITLSPSFEVTSNTVPPYTSHRNAYNRYISLPNTIFTMYHSSE